MTSRIDDALAVSGRNDGDHKYSAARVIDVMDNAITTAPDPGTGGGVLGKDFQAVTYITTSVNPAAIFFTALDMDGVTVITARTADNVYKILDGPGYTIYGYNQPAADGLTDFLAVWDEGNASVYTINSEIFGVGLATGGSGGGGSGLAQAHFTMTQSTSSLITLDASGSTGQTYAWELDTIPRPETDVSVTYGPLTVGTHHVKLTVTDSTDGSFDISERDVAVAWVAEPFDMAQHDVANGPLHAGAGVGLDQWATLPLIGPWRNKDVLNEVTGNGDGDPRIINQGDGSVTLMTRAGDQIGSGGYRSAMAINSAYSGLAAGFPAAYSGNIDVCGNGALFTGGATGSLRFYRIEWKILSTNADGTHPPSYPTALTLQNNFWEIKGNFPGDPIICAAPRISGGSGDMFEVRFASLQNGAQQDGAQVNFDRVAVAWDTWFNHVIEFLPSVDGSVGYIRVYRDGNVVSQVPGGTDGQGRYFAVTAQTDSGGTPVEIAFNAQNYRTRAAIDLIGPYPTVHDVTIQYRKIRVGPTMASVMAL